MKSCRSGSNSGSEWTEAACELTCPGVDNKSEYGQVNQVRRGSCGCGGVTIDIKLALTTFKIKFEVKLRIGEITAFGDQSIST